MKKRVLVHLIMACLVAGLFLTVSCQKKVVQPGETQVEPASSSQDSSSSSSSGADTSSASGKTDTGISEQELAEAKAAAAKRRFVNQDIHFEYDSAELSSMAKMILKEKAAWMKDNSGVLVMIEGHCDERGTTEYNLALGELRAKAARDYMVNLGIAAPRLDTVSFGEEKPVDPGHNEEAWKKNRRAHFAIK